MKKLLVLLLLSCITLTSWSDTRTITKTVTVGQTFDLNPVSMAGISSGRGILSGSATFPNTDGLAIAPSNHSVTIVAANTTGSIQNNGITGNYYTYKVTALKTGTYVITGSASSCISYSSKMESIYWTSYTITERASGSFTCTVNVVDVTSISIPSSKSLSIGESYTFNPTVYQSGAITTLSWSSSDVTVASINSSGELNAIGVGTTTITCTAHNGVSAQCLVTVNPILSSSVSFDVNSAELTTGEQLQLAAKVLPANTTNPAVTWSTSNPSVATVDENGLVTALKSGSCQIKATANDGSGKAASCLLTVLGNVMYCDDIGAVPTAKVTLPIRMKNEDAIQGFEFKLVLPTGTSVVEKNGKPYATLSARFSSAEGLECVYLNDNTYQFVFTSASRIEGSSGIVVKVPLAVSSNMAEGTYEVKIKDVEMVQYATSAQIHHGDRTSKLTINKLLLGDVNGDGRISVADAISIINYVLGRTPASFITKAADVNGDNSISLADAVAVVDIILKRDASSAVKSIKDIIIDPQ